MIPKRRILEVYFDKIYTTTPPGCGIIGTGLQIRLMTALYVLRINRPSVILPWPRSERSAMKIRHPFFWVGALGVVGNQAGNSRPQILLGLSLGTPHTPLTPSSLDPYRGVLGEVGEGGGPSSWQELSKTYHT